MMDDECRACKWRQRTASRCPLSHRVLLAASVNVRKLEKETCQGMGVGSETVIWDLKAPARGSVRQRRAYLESPSLPEHARRLKMRQCSRSTCEPQTKWPCGCTPTMLPESHQ